METKEVKIRLIAKLGSQCFLNGKISRTNPLTGHHIIPLRDGGKTNEDNIALICRLEHDWFNIVEVQDPKIAERLNLMFKIYKQQPNKELREYMRYILVTAFNEIDNGGKKKRKRLI